jgi:hypothetical protein
MPLNLLQSQLECEQHSQLCLSQNRQIRGTHRMSIKMVATDMVLILINNAISLTQLATPSL